MHRICYDSKHFTHHIRRDCNLDYFCHLQELQLVRLAPPVVKIKLAIGQLLLAAEQ